MRGYLNTESNPYNASIEMILPGVQEQLNGVNTVVQNSKSEVMSKIENLSSSMASMATKQDLAVLLNEIKGAMGNLAQAHIKGMQETTRAFSRAYSSFNVLQRGIQPSLRDLHGMGQRGGPVDDHVNQDSVTTGTEIPIQSPAPNNDLPSLKPRLSPRFESLILMWDEWHGTGGPDTKDKPVPGGFCQLEGKYKAKWRQHLDGSQGRHFTRVRLIIEGIAKMANTRGVAVEHLLDELDLEWRKMKFSPDSMVRYLQEQGFLKKNKPRGKGARQQQE